MTPEQFSMQFERVKGELTGYVVRIILRRAVAEEIAQETALRALQNLVNLPDSEDELRAWLYRVATNLAFDHRRRLSTLRETVMLDLRKQAETSLSFAAASQSLRASAESHAIAKEHLAACMACTLSRFPERQAAALLLVEMARFTVAETANILEVRPTQVKGWLTATRAATDEQYGRTCVLVSKQGMCHQCVELDRYHEAHQGDPLEGTSRSFDDRMTILKSQPAGRWTELLAGLLDELN